VDEEVVAGLAVGLDYFAGNSLVLVAVVDVSTQKVAEADHDEVDAVAVVVFADNDIDLETDVGFGTFAAAVEAPVSVESFAAIGTPLVAFAAVEAVAAAVDASDVLVAEVFGALAAVLGVGSY